MFGFRSSPQARRRSADRSFAGPFGLGCGSVRAFAVVHALHGSDGPRSPAHRQPRTDEDEDRGDPIHLFRDPMI